MNSNKEGRCLENEENWCKYRILGYLHSTPHPWDQNGGVFFLWNSLLLLFPSACFSLKKNETWKKIIRNWEEERCVKREKRVGGQKERSSRQVRAMKYEFFPFHAIIDELNWGILPYNHLPQWQSTTYMVSICNIFLVLL